MLVLSAYDHQGLQMLIGASRSSTLVLGLITPVLEQIVHQSFLDKAPWDVTLLESLLVLNSIVKEIGAQLWQANVFEHFMKRRRPFLDGMMKPFNAGIVDDIFIWNVQVVVAHKIDQFGLTQREELVEYGNLWLNKSIRKRKQSRIETKNATDFAEMG